VSWSKRCQSVTAMAASLAREYAPRHTAKWFARVLGCSVRSGKRYSTHPELFPRSRAEELLAALEAEEAEMERRRAERRAQLEALRNELTANLGMGGARLPLSRPGVAGRRMGGDVGEGRTVLPP
jgi:hypothetical protein